MLGRETVTTITPIEVLGSGILHELNQLKNDLGEQSSVSFDNGKYPIEGAQEAINFINGPITDVLGKFANRVGPMRITERTMKVLPFANSFWYVPDETSMRGKPRVAYQPFDFNVSDLPLFLVETEITPQRLDLLWNKGGGRGSIEQLAKLTPKKVIEKFEKYVNSKI